MLTFGVGQLANGASEPVPCQWEENGGVQAGTNVTGCVGVDYGSSGANNGAAIDGVIAPFWADLDPGHTVQEDGEGVYFYFALDAVPLMSKVHHRAHNMDYPPTRWP